MITVCSVFWGFWNRLQVRCYLPQFTNQGSVSQGQYYQLVTFQGPLRETLHPLHSPTQSLYITDTAIASVHVSSCHHFHLPLHPRPKLSPVPPFTSSFIAYIQHHFQLLPSQYWPASPSASAFITSHCRLTTPPSPPSPSPLSSSACVHLHFHLHSHPLCLKSHPISPPLPLTPTHTLDSDQLKWWGEC